MKRVLTARSSTQRRLVMPEARVGRDFLRQSKIRELYCQAVRVHYKYILWFYIPVYPATVVLQTELADADREKRR